MNVLVVGSDALGSLEGIYQRAFARIGCNADLLNVVPVIPRTMGAGPVRRMMVNRYTQPIQDWGAARRFLKYIEHPPRRYDVVVIFKGMEFSPSVLETAREWQPSALWVNINPDDPYNLSSRGSTNENVRNSVRFYDLYCTWSRRLINPLHFGGCGEVMYLPFAYDPELHRPPRVRLARSPKSICFVGAWDIERETIVTALAEVEVRVAGAGWDRVSRTSPLKKHVVKSTNLYAEELAQEIESASVSLNILRSQNATSHNMRTFEIPAMGGLQLTTRSEEQQEYFPEGEASLMFEGTEELKEKAQWVFAHRAEADRIRACGQRLVEGNTYAVRAKALLGHMKRFIGK